MTKKREPAIDLQPIIRDVKLSLDRFQFTYEDGGDLMSALLDLQANVGDLEDGVEKNEEFQS